MFDGFDWGNLFGKLGGSLLGSIASGFVAQGLNAMFAPSPPSRHDIARDVRAQGEALQGVSQPVRTPEQTSADRLALKESEARAATFQQLQGEYNKVEQAGAIPATWDPYTEKRIRDEAYAQASSGGAAVGQADALVNRRLDEYRLKGASTAQDQYQRRLSDLRTQMLPYSQVQMPGEARFPTPTVAPMSRETPKNPYSTVPIDIVSALRAEDQKKKVVPEKTVNQWTPRSPEDEDYR
jgi:hypothetical protein